MTARPFIGLAAALTVALSATGAQAQGRGRTDGAEGSEIGKGGYDRPGIGRFSLQLDWGGASARQNRGAPLFAGLTGTWWADDWLQFEATGQYVLRTGNVNVLVGPKLRSAFYPLSANVGLKAGGILVKDEGLRFGVSPQIGVDALIGRKVLMGLSYAYDIPFGADAETHRLFMSVGYRF